MGINGTKMKPNKYPTLKMGQLDFDIYSFNCHFEHKSKLLHMNINNQFSLRRSGGYAPVFIGITTGSQPYQTLINQGYRIGSLSML